MKLIIPIIFLHFSIPIFGQRSQVYPLQHDPNLAWVSPAVSPYEVGEFEKLEIGISLPESIQYKINSFIATGDSAKGFNPIFGMAN